MSKYLQLAKRSREANGPPATAHSGIAPPSHTTGARRALEGLLWYSSEWRGFFDSCCESGSLRLRSQAGRFRDELKSRGREHSLEDVEDALWELARNLLPNTAAATWDVEWAGELASRALRHLAGLYVGGADLSVLEEWEEKIIGAGVAEDRKAYRSAIREFVRAGVRAFEEMRNRAA